MSNLTPEKTPEKTAVEIVTEFLAEKKIELIVEPPKLQHLPDGNFIVEKPNVVVRFKQETPTNSIKPQN